VLITAADLKGVSDRLLVPINAIITPSAHDQAAQSGITIIREQRVTAPLTVKPGRPTRTVTSVARVIDHTNLSPLATRDDIASLCGEARDYRFASVCVSPPHVSGAASETRGTDVAVCSVVAFPLGAREIDMVANSGLLHSGELRAYYDDIALVRRAIGREIKLKVIIEAPLLDECDIVRAGVLAAEAGADFIKTSTGVYSQARATDVHLLKRALGSRVQIKAAGGIRDAQSACAMLDAGADRLGTSSSIAIMWELGAR
jgi:deoxyribose-phosphate aldolase